MPINLASMIERAITEHGSAAIMRDHLALFRDRAKIIEGENARLKNRVEELEQLTADLATQLADAKKKRDALKAPKRSTTSGELVVDGILWDYTGDNTTGKWLKFEPQCPYCRTELCVTDATPFLALEPNEHQVRYHCDFPKCGKTNVILVGNAGNQEAKAARHILRAHRVKNA